MKSFLGKFYRHLAIFIWSHWSLVQRIHLACNSDLDAIRGHIQRGGQVLPLDQEGRRRLRIRLQRRVHGPGLRQEGQQRLQVEFTIFGHFDC